MPRSGSAGKAAFSYVEHERAELIRETGRTDDQDIGASEEAIEYESKKSVMYRWAIAIGLFVLFAVLLIFFVWYVTT